MSLWHAAGLAERLPARRFRLAQEFNAAEATQLCFGLCLRRLSLRSLSRREERGGEPRGAAQCRYGNSWPRPPSRCAWRATGSIRRPPIWVPRNWLLRRVSSLSAIGAAIQEWVGEQLLSANFPAIHAVGRASSEAPRLVELRWAPRGGEDYPCLTLVGKGVCFDSGGLDIKPERRHGAHEKRHGRRGRRVVARALAHERQDSRALRVLVPAVENAISGNAYRPGDVLATRKGLTVEVGNTDAEGRLVLCDALAFADAEHPDLIIDFATLTGAARVALGTGASGLVWQRRGAWCNDLARVAAAEHDPLVAHAAVGRV